jgi:sugar phosphate isomerase/epimerase
MKSPWKIGILVDSLKLGLADGVRKAAELGADGFQMFVTRGEVFPDNFPAPKRREFKKMSDGLGLEISALCADFDWIRGFTDADFNAVNIPRIKKCVDLAVDLDTRIVTMHIGRLPDDQAHPAYREALRAATVLAEYAAPRRVTLCSETGPEAPAKLQEFLRQTPEKGIGVNYDPANLVMCGPFDHIGGVGILKDYIGHTHAKDGICLGNGKWKELPLGQGGVVFPYYLAALKAAGYAGYLTIEREEGQDRVGDVSRAVEFLRQLAQADLPSLKA